MSLFGIKLWGSSTPAEAPAANQQPVANNANPEQTAAPVANNANPAPVAAPVAANANPAQSAAPVETAEQRFERLLTTIDEKTTKVFALWKTKVTDASFFVKYSGIGVISYFWNRSEAVKADQAAQDSMVEFNASLKLCVEAISKQDLNPETAKVAGVGFVVFDNTKDQNVSYSKATNSSDMQKKFYEVFKKRCTYIGVAEHSFEFFICAKAAAHRMETQLTVLGQMGKVPFMPTSKDNLNTSVNSFNRRIFEDVITAFASLSLDTLTHASFFKKAQELKEFYPAISSVDIEHALRLALKQKHEGAFATLADEYASTAANNPRIETLKQHIVDGLNVEKAAMERRVAELRNTGWGSESLLNTSGLRYHTAETNLAAANGELLGAMGTFQNAYREHYNLSTNPQMNNPEYLLTLLAPGLTLSAALNDAKDKLGVAIAKKKAAQTEFDAAKEAHEKLQKELAEIVVFNEHGQPIWGKLVAINGAIADAGERAKRDAQTICGFLRQLDKTQTSANANDARILAQRQYDAMNPFRPVSA